MMNDSRDNRFSHYKEPANNYDNLTHSQDFVVLKCSTT